jgi:hypothetical protein
MLHATMVRVPSKLQIDLAHTNWALLWGKMLALILRLMHTHFQHQRQQVRLARKNCLPSQQSLKIGLVESYSARGHIAQLHNAGTVK